jgi:hypothetical protein
LEVAEEAKVWVLAVVLVICLALYLLHFALIGYREAEAEATLPTTRVVRSWYTKVVGVTKKNTDGTPRQEVIRNCSEGERLLLVREPQNPYDPNAIKVCRLSGDQIGYISSDIAERMADEMDTGKRFSARIEDMTGGTRGKPSLGVNIVISVHE